MDLGIAGKTALVCAASKGLGRACAYALAREGAAVTITARAASPLEATAEAIRKETGADVNISVGDITSPEGRAAALEVCPEPDILVTNAGGPPPGDFRDWDRDAWVAAVDANMIAPILMIRAVVDRMIERRFGRIVNITSYSVKLPQPALGLSNGARAGLTGFVAGLARETVRHNVTINNLLPGPFDTDRWQSNVRYGAEASGRDFDAEWEARMAGMPVGRVGDPAEFGDACAYFCSAQAGYMTGQNIMLDGGLYGGTL